MDPDPPGAGDPNPENGGSGSVGALPATQVPHWRCTLLPRAWAPSPVRTAAGPRRPLSPRRLSIFDNASSLLASVLTLA